MTSRIGANGGAVAAPTVGSTDAKGTVTIKQGDISMTVSAQTSPAQREQLLHDTQRMVDTFESLKKAPPAEVAQSRPPRSILGKVSDFLGRLFGMSPNSSNPLGEREKEIVKNIRG